MKKKNKKKPFTILVEKVSAEFKSAIDTADKQPNIKPYNLLVYVLNSTPHMRKFDTMEQMGKFVEKFQKKYPDYMSIDSGNWIDYVISDIRGEISFFTDGISVK